MPSCGIKFHARGNVIESIENWKENPRHILCSKGLATLQRLYNPNRLLHPMKRTNPKGSEDPGFVRCSWEEAYRMIAENLLRIRKQYGADSVMFYAGDPKDRVRPSSSLARLRLRALGQRIVGRLPRRLHAGRAAHLGPSVDGRQADRKDAFLHDHGDERLGPAAGLVGVPRQGQWPAAARS